VIGEHVSIALVDEAGKKVPSLFNPFVFDTDDRGVYRVYGLRGALSNQRRANEGHD
jgi:hypothetical protein